MKSAGRFKDSIRFSHRCMKIGSRKCIHRFLMTRPGILLAATTACTTWIWMRLGSKSRFYTSGKPQFSEELLSFKKRLMKETRNLLAKYLEWWSFM